MLQKIEATVNGTKATYFISDVFDKETVKEVRRLTRDFRIVSNWLFNARFEPTNREDFRADFPATNAAMEAAGVDIDAVAAIWEAHNG